MMIDEKTFISKLKEAPDIYEDFGTISYQSKYDIWKKFGDKNYNCLEMGSYRGYTTRLLSSIFNNVVGLEVSEDILEHCRKNNSDNPNVSFEKVDLYDKADWERLEPKLKGKFEVALVDASHSYEHCKDDLIKAIDLGCKHLIVDDVGLYGEVAKALAEIVDEYDIKDLSGMGIDFHHYKLPYFKSEVCPVRSEEQNVGISSFNYSWRLRDKMDIYLNDNNDIRPMFSPMNVQMNVIKNHIKVVDGHLRNKVENGEIVHMPTNEIQELNHLEHFDISNLDSVIPEHDLVCIPYHRVDRIFVRLTDNEVYTDYDDTIFEGAFVELK